MEAVKQLEHIFDQVKKPLAVNKKCIAKREKREGIESVLDIVQVNLDKERNNIEKYITKIKETIKKVLRDIYTTVMTFFFLML